jgi:hypothetical protein
VPLGGYDTRQWDPMACDHEYTQEGRVTDEKVALFVDGQAVRSGDTETRDCCDQKVSMVGEVERELDIQNLQAFVVVPSLCRGHLHTLFSLVMATYRTYHQHRSYPIVSCHCIPSHQGSRRVRSDWLRSRVDSLASQSLKAGIRSLWDLTYQSVLGR